MKVEMQDLFDEYLEYREINKLREIQRLTLELEEDEIAALMLKTAIKDEGVQKNIVSAWVELSSLGNGYLDKHLEKRLGVEPIARSASPQPPSFLSQSTPPEVRETKVSSLYVTSKNVLYAEAGSNYTDELAVEAAAILMEKGYDKIELFKPRCLSEEEQGVFVATLRDELISRGFPAEKLTVPTIIEPQAEETHESKYDNSNKRQFKKRNFKGKKGGGYSKSDPGHFDGQQEQYAPYQGGNDSEYGEPAFDDNYANYTGYDDSQYAEQPSYDEPPYYAPEGLYGEPDSDMEQNNTPTSFPDNSSYDGFAEPESEEPANAPPANEQSTGVAPNDYVPPEPPPYDGETMSGDYMPPEPPPYDGEPMSGDY
ncbi:hypothetical protein, partial [Vibrio crassostreae]|uniref:hypothetical protein n=1 Tax=Vibrio crassostreae TaxID=246167 RepID=UPI001B30C98A